MISQLKLCQLSHQAFHKQLNSAIVDFNIYIWKTPQPTNANDIEALLNVLNEKAEEIHHLKSTMDFSTKQIQKLEEQQ